MAERTVIQSITASRGIVSLGSEASVFQAACTMSRAHCGSILIVSPQNELLGILTERDLMVRVIAENREPHATPVAQVMTRSPYCVAPETPVTEAIAIMMERGFRHLPIVADNHRLLGVFSIRDAMPREIDTAAGVVQFHEQLNDALA